MADDRSKPLYVDPQILARDLGDSLSAAGRATTSPDDESQLREASRRLGIPLDTARANPVETKRAVEQDSFDASDYASQFPSSAKYLADQQNALIAKDDVQPLSEVEKTLRRQVAENMAGGPITDGTSAGRRALPTLTSDREEEQQVLRTEGFAAASRLQRTNASRREAEQYAGSMAATPPSEVRKFFDSLGRGIGSTTDAAVSGLQYSDVGIAGAFQSLFDTIAPAMDPLAGTILPENPLRRVAAGLADYRQKGTNSADARMPKGESNLSAGFYSGISSLSRNLVALPLALVPGGQGAALSMMTAPVYGQEYGKAKDDGKSTSTAIAYGGTQALIEYATEKLPLTRLIGDVKQGTPFLRTLARQMALEVPGEQVATALQDLTEWAVLNPEKSFQDYVDARPDAAMQTLVATVVGTGGQVSIISGLQVAADKIAGREARAQREQDRAASGAEQLEQLMAAAAASMTRVRDPQSFSQLVQEAAEDSGTAPTELFVDARRLVEILPQEMLAQLPSVQEQLEEALATDGAVVIPIGEATTTLAGTGFEQELVRNARVTEDAWTAAEAEEGRDLVAQLEQEALQVTEEQTQAQAWEESSKQVFDTLMGELTTAARFAPDVNRAYATLVRNFYTVQAARTGTTPQELYERYPLTVSSRGPGVTDNTLDQEGPSVIPSEKPGAVRVRGVHYSAARRDVLDGRYFGTGLKGAERARLQGLPEDSPLRSRVLAYVDEGSGIRPEQGVGSVAHSVSLDNIYDTGTDPLGIWSNRDANAREQAVLDAGFDGYYAPAAMNMGGNKDMGVVALLGEAAYAVPTSPYGGERAQAAPKPQASEMRQALEEFRGHPELQYGAPSARLWGVFTKMKAPELYEKLAPTGIFEGEENLYKSDLIARVQGQGVFAQNVATPEGEVDASTREAGNRGGRYSSGNLAPLEGAPTVAGAAGPDPRLVSVAEQYARDNGIDLRRQAEFAEVDPERAARIAQAYAEMRHAPNDPKVKEAYDDLIRQTRAQYDALVAAGYQFTLFGEGSDPYGGNPWNAMRDLRANQRMAVYATEAGFGVGAQVNIGLADPQGGADLNPAQVIEALRAVGAEVEVSSVYSSDTEPTMVAKLKQALTKEQGDRVSEMLGQEAIAQRTDDEQGQLFGPMAEQWGPYNPAYFVTTTGDRADAIANPLLQDTGLQWPNQNGEMRPVLANDLFRAVHDAFGHGLEGAGFRARGEENAWQAHARLFTGPAVGAITTETRGQNSWLNYGPYGEQNQNAAVEDTVFAEQKTGLMPEWVWAEGRVGDEQAAQGEVFNQSPIDASLDEVLRLTPDEYMDLVNPSRERSDEDGSARLVRGALTDPQNATVLRELDGGVTIERDAEGNVYARQGGDTIGEIINYGDEVNANVLPEARGAGVATAMVAEFIRANPVFNAGSLTAGGEAAVRAAFRQLQAERGEVLNQSVPQTETEAFKRWFGDSKVVDADGNPLPLWHGSAADFDAFDLQYANTDDPDVPVIGFHLSSDEGRARGKTANQNRQFFVAVRNPATGAQAFAERRRLEEATGRSPSNKEVTDGLIAKGYDGVVMSQPWAFSQEEIDRTGRGLTHAGADNGYELVREGDDYNLYSRGNHVTSFESVEEANEAGGEFHVVAFRPEQIKSATGNNGNFDPADTGVFNQSARFPEGNRLSNLDPSGPSWERIRAANPALAKTASQDDTVTVYRATVGDSIRPDDFVAVDRAVAEMELENVTDRDGDGARIIEQQVRVRDLLMGNDATEFVYAPEVLSQSVPQTETEAFKRWFGDSKVVDAEGKPLVVYHGTPTPFTEFKKKYIGARDPGFFGSGFYFTPDENDAQDYADSAAEADGQSGDGSTTPAYLSLQNPFIWDMSQEGSSGTRSALAEFGIRRSSVRGDSAALANPEERKAFAKGMKAKGHDGVIIRDEDGFREIVAFEPTQIKSATGNNGNFDPADPSILNQTTGARATFNPATLDIALLQKADLSSFLHETGHFFFEMQAILASQPDAPQALVDDMQVLLNHVGFTGTAAEWMAQSVNARRDAHETVAESFEQYLFTGKAPTAELQPLFHRFRSWMISVYRSLQQFLATNKRAGLNPDIAAVFDRMLASEKAINDALAVRQFAPMFGSAADAGMTDEAFAAYQEDIDRQQADALDAVQARTLRDLKWLDNARGRKLKELQKEAAAQRKAVRDEVTAEVNAQPVYRAMEFLKYGRVESDGEQIQVEVTKAAKLNITEVQAMYPEGELGTGADWRSLGYGKYGMLSDAGLHPDTVAEMFGFRSGRQLVTALLEAESKTELINGLTDQRMLERYGDIASPQAMQEAANEALANEARARLVATELAALTKATGKPGLIARAARQAAEQMVAAKPVRNLRPDLAAASAARARKAAEAAMAKGDTASAAAAKRTEILQIQLERVQRKAQQDHDKALRDFKKIFKGTNEKIAKSRDIGMVNAARGVLARYGLAPKTSAANAQAYAELLANYDGAMSADINSILQGLPLPADFRDLTVEQFRGVRDVVNGLYYLARRSRQVEIDGQKLEIDAVADELVAATTARAGGVVPPLPGYAGTPTERDKWMAGLHSAKAALTRVEFWSDNMGPAFKKYIWNPVAEATTRMRTQRTELIRQYRDLLQGIEKGITYNKIDAPELGAVGFTFNAGKSELLHAILHTGNKSNLTKLLLGRGWGTLDANGALDTQRWDQFVTRMITEGVLTKADFDFAQGVWDLLETVKKDAQAAHKEMYGYYFNEVTADAIDTPFGQYRGGYVPALADSLSSPEMAQKREQEDLLHAGNSFMFPTTGKGFTQSRVFFNRPLELDLRTIGSHLDKFARFAYLEPTVRDVNQLISNKRVARALNGANPGAISDMLTPWLQRTARQSTSMPGKNPKVNRFFNGLRSRTGMVFMFGNVVNTLQQLTGFSLAALRVPAPKLLRATARYMGNPLSMRAEVAAKSPWLAERMDSQSYAMQDQIDEILTNPGAYEKTVEFAKRHAYFLQQAMQNVMDPIVWSGAYDHALTKGVTEKEAIRYADEAVRTTQGSFAPEDVAGFEVQSPFVRLFTQFYGYFNMWGNLLGNEANKAVREMGYTKASPRLLFIWFAGVAIPSVVAEIISRGLPDDEDDEDGDGLLDEWLALFFGSQAKSLAATVPGVGHLAVLGANMLDNKVYNDRFNISPALSAAESAVRGGASLLSGALLDEDVKKREVRDILTLIGLGTGLPVAPVSRAAGYAADVNSGAVEPEGALDVGAGLLLGR